MTTIHQDWKDFLNALLSENTRFLLIGAHALAYHVEARLTEDIDVFVEPSRDNAARLHRALERFGFGSLVPEQAELAEPNRVFMLGRKPWRIDVLTGIDGVTFEEAWQSRVDGGRIWSALRSSRRWTEAIRGIPLLGTETRCVARCSTSSAVLGYLPNAAGVGPSSVLHRWRFPIASHRSAIPDNHPAEPLTGQSVLDHSSVKVSPM